MSAPSPAIPDKPPIPFDDFVRLDLRVATVIACDEHPSADRLFRIRLDDGTPEGRQVCAGIRGSYRPEELVGRQVVIVANLEPRTIRGERSEGMILAASDAGGGEGEGRTIVVVTLDKPVAPGSRVS